MSLKEDKLISYGELAMYQHLAREEAGGSHISEDDGHNVRDSPYKSTDC